MSQACDVRHFLANFLNTFLPSWTPIVLVLVLAFSSWSFTNIECENTTDGGTIGYDTVLCDGENDPPLLVSLTEASGGSGELEYLWLSSTSSCPDNLTQAIPDAIGATYDPGPLTTTTWFRRCSRRSACQVWSTESNCVMITVTEVCNECEDDIEPPVLSGVPSDQNSECDNIPAVPTVTATDNCVEDPEVIFTQEREEGDCPGDAILTRTWTVYDDNGNVAAATQVITIRDTESPKMFGVPEDVDVTCNEIPPIPTITADDNCTDDSGLTVSFEQERINGDCDHSYTLLRIWSVADECGNELEEIQTITVRDDENPELVDVPNDINVNPANGETIPSPAIVTANDNCDDSPSVLFEESSVMDGCQTIITRTWTATDNCGNESSDSQIITVLCTTTCDADAGSLAPNPEMYCLVGANITISALHTADPVIPAGYNLLYVLTSGSDLLIRDASPTPNFIISLADNYTIHTLVYDPNTLDLGIINLGTTTGFDINDLLIQGGGDICAALDVIGAPVVVTEDCGCQNPVVDNVVTRNTSCDNSTGSITIDMVGANSDYSYEWSATPGSLNGIGNQQTDLPGGAYQVTITEGNCETVRDIFVSNTDGPVPATVLSTPATCELANGTANLVSTNLNYTWLFDGLMTPVRSDLSGGVYTVRVDDPSQPDCINFIEVTVGTIQAFSVSVDVTQQSNCSEDSGMATILTSGGSGNYSFLWSDGMTFSDATRNDLPAGSYSVIVTDNDTGCSDDVLFSINNGDVFGAEITINTDLTPDCPTNFDGTLDYNVTPDAGFIFPIRIEIKDSDNATVANGMLGVGTYCLLVFDGNDCLAASECFEITQPEAIAVHFSVVEATSCDGGGAINLEPTTGGDGNYNYDWADLPGNDNPASRSDLTGGDYSLTVTDGLGCTAVVEDINVPGPDDCVECETPIVTNIVVVETSCDNSDGIATIDLNVNIADYDFVWTPNVSNSANATGLSAGTYVVVITDSETGTCTTSIEFEVGTSEGPEAEDISITAATCLAEDGTASLLPTDYNYQWSDNVVANTRDDLAAGTYFVTITDPTTGCENVIALTIPEENNLVIDAKINDRSTCGDNNGSVTILVTGGSGNYNYSWGPDDRRDDLAAGMYSVTVVDPENGCTVDIMFVLDDQLSTATVEIQDSIIQLACVGDNNGLVDFTVTPDANFNGIPNIQIVDQDGNEATNGSLIPGNYCIMVLDANDCYVTEDCFVILSPELLDVDIQIKNESCEAKGSILVEVRGGDAPYTFNWADIPGNDNDPARSDLDGGTYDLTITDASGCTAVSQDITVGSPVDCEEDCNDLEVTSIVVREATCNNNDGEATIQINLNPADYSYTWTPNVSNSSTASNLSAGIYTVLIVNNENSECTTFVEFAVGNSNGPEPTSIDIIPATCLAQDGEVTFLPNDFTYTWSDNQVTNSRADLAAGTYFVTITDPTTNCLDVIAVTVESENGLEATANVNQNPACGESNGSVTIEVTGGSGTYGFSWGGATRDNLASGIYDVTVVDPGTGCFTNVLFPLSDDVAGAEINIENENEIVTIACAGDANGMVDFTVVPDANFSGTPQITIVDEDGNEQENGSLNIGTYCIVVNDDNGCLAAQRCFSVEGNSLLDVDVIALNKTCLSDGSISLVTTGGVAPYTFDWADLPGNDNGSDRTDLLPESYSVTITDDEGCNVVIDNINIIDTCIPTSCETPIVENTVKIAASCNQSNGSAFLEMVGDNADFAYSWTPNVSDNAFANNIPAGVYTVVISRLNDPACQTTTTFAIENADGPQPEIISTTPATCNEANGTAVLGPVSFQYEWCNGLTGFSVNNLPAGSCFVTVTDFSTGCLNYVEIIIDEFNPLEVTVNIDELPSCNENDGAVSIDVANGSTSYTYAWSDGGGGASRDNLSAGFYTVTVTDNGATGCERVTSFVLLNDIDATATITIDENPVLLSCIGSENGMVDFTVSPEPGFAEPFTTTIFAANGQEVTNGQLITGEYCIVVTDADGCDAGQSCFSVEEPTALVLDIITQNQTCDTTGMIFVEASGGNGGYNFDWQDIPGPTDTADRTDLTTGAYTLIVTDQNGCTAIANNLPIINECSNCPSADTVNVNLPTNSLTEYCFELESCFDSVGISYELLDGGFAGLSGFGSWTLDSLGCLNYISNAFPGIGVDTICIIANDNGLPDTTCVIISITTDCEISNGDTLVLPTFDCEAGADFCLPIGILEIDNYEISDNGSFYNGNFVGCQSDTSLIYRFDNFLIDFPIGPYQLMGWPVNGGNISVDTFLTISDLLDSIAILDPMGNWELDGNNIVTSSINGVYGAMALRSYASSDQRIIQGEINIDNDGTQLSLDSGFHQIITFDLVEGCVDTFNILVDCRNCPGIYDGPTELVAENCDGAVPICVDLSISQIINYRITDNGATYMGGFLGCNIDSLVQYDVTNLFDLNLFGLEEWSVQGNSFSAQNLTSPQELVDSFNVWFPAGNWRLDEFLILGDNFNNNYGTAVISLGGVPVENIEPGLQPIPNGLELAIDTGFHQIIVENLAEGCIDTLDLNVICLPCLDETYLGQPEVMAAECEDLTPICLELTVSQILNYEVTDNGLPYTNGFLGCNVDTTVLYDGIAFSNNSVYTLNSWQVNNNFFSMGQFIGLNELVDSMNVWDPTGDWILLGTELIGGDLSNNYGDMIVSQFGVIIDTAEPGFNLQPQGAQMELDTGMHQIILRDSIAGCVDTFNVNVICDDFVPLPTDTIPLEILINFTDTFCMDTTVLPGIIDTIFNICADSSGTNVNFTIDPDTYCVSYQGIGIGTDPACIVLCDDAGHCDTTVLLVTVNPPMSESITTEIFFGDVDQFCIDTTELAGNIDTIFNACPELSNINDEIELVDDTWCVIFESIGLGQDTACIVICDDLGVCDTTFLAITNLTLLGEGPIAIDDDSLTVINTSIEIDILGNDTINGDFIGLEIINGPSNGTAIVGANNIIYSPEREFCGVDSFQYVLSTSTGQDTATVTVTVLCEELTIFNGFSPNGDGVNDNFIILGIERFPDSRVQIFNRWGNKVYDRTGYTNDDPFSGRWNDQDLPDGTYFYIIEDGEGEQYSGWLQIHR